MWSKLDDALIDHRKVFHAAQLIGKNGGAITIGFFAIGLMWTNKQLTDGFLPEAVVKTWRHVDKPLAVADALVTATLWDSAPGGYRIHDFHDHNPLASDVLAKRAADRDRKKKGGKNRHTKSGGEQ